MTCPKNLGELLRVTENGNHRCIVTDWVCQAWLDSCWREEGGESVECDSASSNSEEDFDMELQTAMNIILSSLFL